MSRVTVRATKRTVRIGAARVRVVKIGVQGPEGAPGARWITGDGAPTAALGCLHDLYLERTFGDVYRKLETGWVLDANIKGLPGEVAATLPWTSITSKPAAFPSSPHTHISGEITDFDAAVQDTTGQDRNYVLWFENQLA